MFSFIKRFFRSGAWKYALMGAVIGCVLFLSIYGTRSLIPTNVYWVYHSPSTDMPGHQIGFDFFRNDKWHFQLGMYERYSEDQLSSVVYSDSCAPMAILFKLFDPVLPEFFQYWGIWTLLCFMLHGTFAALIFRKLCMDMFSAAIAVVIMVCNSSLLFRVFHHSTLVAQWLILIMILIWLYRDKLKRKKRRVIVWSVFTSVAVSIHLYLFIMTGVFMVIFMVYDSIKNKAVLSNLKAFVSAVVSVCVTWCLVGGMVAKVSRGETMGLGLFSLNLLSPFNSMGKSLYVPGLAHLLPQEMEDTGYLGMGGFVLLAIGIVVVLKNSGRIILFLRERRLETISVVVLMLGFIIFSLSPYVSCGDRIVFDYSKIIPDFIMYIWRTLRSTARFFWPVQYSVYVALIFIASKGLKKDRMIALLILCAFIQYVDVVPAFAKLYDRLYDVRDGYSSVFYDTLKESLSPDVKRVAMITDPYIRFIEPAMFAAKTGRTINVAYLSRLEDWDVEDAIKDWNSRSFREDTVYCVPVSMLYKVDEIAIPEDCECLTIDGYTILIKKTGLQGSAYEEFKTDNETLNKRVRNMKEYIKSQEEASVGEQ